ncbi:MAG: hypothetical protein PUK39_11040, partial [Clostridiales bacterium]|nr:hypothetical protein [Clostridiales bacterium]
FVKNFFQILFELLMIAARFDQFLSRSELIYFSTSSSVCQELFSRFFNRFLGPHPICRALQNALL